MPLTPEEEHAKSEGWAVPRGSDYISLGDDAIRTNAVRARELIRAISSLKRATPDTDGLMGSDDKAKLDGYPEEPSDVAAASVDDAMRLDSEHIAFTLTNGQTTSPVELGMGRDGSNVLPTEEAIVDAILDPYSIANQYLNTQFLTARAEDDEVQLGPELISSDGWSAGTGWAGSFADGFTHTPGSTAELTWTPPVDPAGTVWVVQWTITAPSGTGQFPRSDVEVYFGGGWAGITYQGSGLVGHYSRAIRSTTGAPLRFIPLTTFSGRIHDISIRPLGDPIGPVSVWRNSAGEVTNEARMSGQDNFFMGRDSGRYVADVRNPARYNTAVGNNSAANLSTGFFNTALGERALHEATSGTRNVAIGYRSLEQIHAGDRNVGIGPFAGAELVDGQRNVMVGVDVLYQTRSSSDNIGLGYLAMHAADDVDSNVAIGRIAMGAAQGASQAVALGTMAARYAEGEHVIAIGMYALRNNTSDRNVGVGGFAFDRTTTESMLVGIGFRAGQYWIGDRNTAIGFQALRSNANGAGGDRNVAIGDDALENLEDGERNVAIGSRAGRLLTSGSGNILIGNVNSHPAATGSDRLNIGNTIYGNLQRRQIGFGVINPTAILHLPASDGTPETAPLKLMPDGALLTTPEPGSLEYAGGKLYFTTGDGRFEVQLNPTT